MRRALNSKQRQEVMSRRAAGETVADLADDYGVCKATIRRVERASGIAPRPRALLNDIQKAEARRRHAAGDAFKTIAADYGVSIDTVRRACMRKGTEERHALGTAIHLAARAAELFGLTLEQLQVSPGRGHPSIEDPVPHARAAAVAAMRVGERPIAWEVITAVLAPDGGEHARMNLNRIFRRARATSREAA